MAFMKYNEMVLVVNSLSRLIVFRALPMHVVHGLLSATMAGFVLLFNNPSMTVMFEA